MVITEEDHHWLKNEYPGLSIKSVNSGYEVEGNLEFFAAYDEVSRLYYINPSPDHCRELICIQDNYDIKIEIDENSIFPKIWETGNKILNYAKNHNIKPINLHIYENGEICAIGHLDRYLIFSFKDFINQPVLQYFYDQSYYFKYGCWPRGQFSHGVLGLLENLFAMNIDMDDILVINCIIELLKLSDNKKYMDYIEMKTKVQGHIKCHCGSGQEFRVCHHDAFMGLGNLQRYLKNKPHLIEEAYKRFRNIN